MRSTFNYFYQNQPTDSITIEDIGNVCIESNNDYGDFYYLLIRTSLGTTKEFIFGPVNEKFPDMGCYFSYNKNSYNERHLCQIIDKFLNKQGITQANIVNFEDIEDKIISPKEMIENAFKNTPSD